MAAIWSSVSVDVLSLVVLVVSVIMLSSAMHILANSGAPVAVATFDGVVVVAFIHGVVFHGVVFHGVVFHGVVFHGHCIMVSFGVSLGIKGSRLLSTIGVVSLSLLFSFKDAFAAPSVGIR
jgi:hypothetical protein